MALTNRTTAPTLTGVQSVQSKPRSRAGLSHRTGRLIGLLLWFETNDLVLDPCASLENSAFDVHLETYLFFRSATSATHPQCQLRPIGRVTAHAAHASSGPFGRRFNPGRTQGSSDSAQTKQPLLQGSTCWVHIFITRPQLEGRATPEANPKPYARTEPRCRADHPLTCPRDVKFVRPLYSKNHT